MVGAVLIGAAATIAVVPRGYEGVVYDLNGGIVSESLSEGLHLVPPIKQHVTNINIQVGVYVHNNEDVWQHTKDTQEIRIPIAVNWRVSDAAYVYQYVQGDPEATIVEPALLRSLRSVIGQFELEKVSENQALINELIAELMTPQLEAHGLEVVFVAIEDTIAKADILKAIEDEKIAERNKLTAEHNRDIAFIDAEGVVYAATGEADARVLNAEARQQEQRLLGMSSVEYVWYTTWSGILPQVILGTDADFIVNLP